MTQEFYHMYHRGQEGQVIFYCAIDRLVYYTLSSVLSRKYNVSILSAAYMFTHTHQTGRSSSSSVTRLYLSQLGRLYARMFNDMSGLPGRLFSPRSGLALKRTEKEIRTNLAYLANNSVEKRLFGHCWQDRWNFVAYAGSPFPFSEPLVRRTASRRLRTALAIVQGEYQRGEYLDYILLLRLFTGLSPKETQQLIDAIISIYTFIDYEAAVGFYGSYEKMILAFDSNTGAEYGFTEAWEPPSDIPYQQMCGLARKMGFNLAEKKFLRTCPPELFAAFLRDTEATPYQIRRFLHLSDID